MIELAGVSIGGWCNMGCVYVFNSKVTNPNDTVTWQGYMQIAQGGDPNYGQKTPVVVIYYPESGIYNFARNCGPGLIQTAEMNYVGDVDLVGTRYRELLGPSNGPGTGGNTCVIRVLQ